MYSPLRTHLPHKQALQGGLGHFDHVTAVVCKYCIRCPCLSMTKQCKLSKKETRQGHVHCFAELMMTLVKTETCKKIQKAITRSLLTKMLEEKTDPISSYHLTCCWVPKQVLHALWCCQGMLERRFRSILNH